MARVHERGSVVGFVLGAILLAGLLFGSIYLAKNYNSKKPSTVPGTGVNAPSAAPKVSEGDKKQGSTQQTDKSSSVASKPTDQLPISDVANSSNSHDKKDVASSAATPSTSNAETVPQAGYNAGSLPQTGPVEQLMSAVGIGALVLVYSEYRKSLRF